ncbi:MAG TPA: acyltransferase [Polyangiaceae bacterium]|nr:acyltransferase [Polyangiaceae bacterium]
MSPEKPRPGFLALELLDNRFPVLHGLRVLAILSVVQLHVTAVMAGEQHITLDPDLSGFSVSIFFGMDMFFVLSGFLIGTILLRSLEQHGSQNIRRFYVRRAFRTFPLYYVVLVALALGTTLTPQQRAHLPYELIYATNFMPGGHTQLVMSWGWSLALEEQFYLTVPLLFVLLWKLPTDRARLALLGALWASALAVRLFIFYRYGPWEDFALFRAIYVSTYTRYDTLVCGIGLAFVHVRHKDRMTAWLADPFHRALLAVPALGCLWLLVRPELFGRENLPIFHVFAWGTLTTVMYFTSLLLFLSGAGSVTRALSRPVFRRMATLGYGVYLVHIPILQRVILPMAKGLGARKWPLLVVWPLSFVLVMVASFALSYALHVLVEKPSLRLRERIAA